MTYQNANEKVGCALSPGEAARRVLPKATGATYKTLRLRDELRWDATVERLGRTFAEAAKEEYYARLDAWHTAHPFPRPPDSGRIVIAPYFGSGTLYDYLDSVPAPRFGGHR